MNWRKSIAWDDIKPFVQPFGWMLGLLLVYVLSLGPVIRYTEVKSATGRRTVPSWVGVCYYPLLNSDVPFISNLLDRYVQFWAGHE